MSRRDMDLHPQNFYDSDDYLVSRCASYIGGGNSPNFSMDKEAMGAIKDTR